MYRDRRHRRDTSSSFSIGIAMIAFVVFIIMGILWTATSTQLFEAREELETVRAELMSAQVERDAAIDELYALRTATVRAVFVYDPAETIYRPADPSSPDAVKLIWFLGKVENLLTTNGDVVAPLSLTGYTCVYSDGRNIAGQYSVLLEAVQHQSGQMEELLAAVDAEIGFIDR